MPKKSIDIRWTYSPIDFKIAKFQSLRIIANANLYVLCPISCLPYHDDKIRHKNKNKQQLFQIGSYQKIPGFISARFIFQQQKQFLVNLRIEIIFQIIYRIRRTEWLHITSFLWNKSPKWFIVQMPERISNSRMIMFGWLCISRPSDWERVFQHWRQLYSNTIQYTIFVQIDYRQKQNRLVRGPFVVIMVKRKRRKTLEIVIFVFCHSDMFIMNVQ